MDDEIRRERAGYPGWPPDDILPKQLAYRGALVGNARPFATPGIAADALYGAMPGELDPAAYIYVERQADGLWLAYVDGHKIRWGAQDPTRLLRMQEEIIAELTLALPAPRDDA